STARCWRISPCTTRTLLARSPIRPRRHSESRPDPRDVSDLASVVEQALREVASCGAPAALEDCRVRWLGKKGGLTEQLKALGALPVSERPAAGARINEAK